MDAPRRVQQSYVCHSEGARFYVNLLTAITRISADRHGLPKMLPLGLFHSKM